MFRSGRAALQQTLPPAVFTRIPRLTLEEHELSWNKVFLADPLPSPNSFLLLLDPIVNLPASDDRPELGLPLRGARCGRIVAVRSRVPHATLT